MTLSKEDGELFYRLWMPLLDYTNKKLKVNSNLGKMAGVEKLDPAKVKEVADHLWKEVSIIDEYLSKHPELPEEHREIIAGWKKCVTGRFLLERHLKKGSIFVDVEDDSVYQVKGIISTWEEMLWGLRLPLLIDATLIPFRDVIITDGLISVLQVVIGGGIAKSCKDIYMNAKRNGKIHRSL